MGYNHERRYELSLKWKGERNRASLFFNDYQNLAGLPTVKAGITELTFSGGNATLTHNAGFPDVNYAVLFICSNVRMFPRMCTNIDGNKTTLSASAVNGSGAIANLEGKYQVMWIVARGA